MLPTHRRHLTCAAIVAALCIAGPSRTSFAQAPVAQGSAAADEVTRAKRLLRQGNEAFREGDFIAAERSYRQAYALRAGYDTAGNLGNALLKLSRHAEAAGYLDECVRTLPATAPAALRERMSGALDEAKAGAGSIRVTVNVVGAEIAVDGTPVGRSPLDRALFVQPGQRNVTAHRGDESASARIDVAKGSSQSVTLTIDVGPNKAVLIAGGAAAAIGLGLGLTFAILSNGKAGDADDLSERLGRSDGPGACLRSGNGSACAKLAGLREDEALFANVSAWSFIGGGAALAATTVYLVVASREERAAAPESGVRVAPAVVAGGGGLVIEGRW